MKFGMNIVPIEGETYYECEADSQKEAEEIAQEYANNNFCYGVDANSIEVLEEDVDHENDGVKTQ